MASDLAVGANSEVAVAAAAEDDEAKEGWYGAAFVGGGGCGCVGGGAGILADRNCTIINSERCGLSLNSARCVFTPKRLCEIQFITHFVFALLKA